MTCDVQSPSRQSLGQQSRLSRRSSVCSMRVHSVQCLCHAETRPAESRPAEQTAPEVIEEPEHKEASEDEDVMEAVARSRRRDAGLEALLQRRQSNDEAGPSNSDEEEEVHLLHPHCPAA